MGGLYSIALSMEPYYVVDSRQVTPGSIFVALKGEKTDGHLFLREVKERGARQAIVSLDYQGEGFGLELIKVDDPLFELQERAKRKLALFPKVITIGVTGSVGKTTTKEFLGTLLKERYKVAKTPGNANTQISLPLTLLNDFAGDEEVLILEMGMTGKGHIKRLTEIAPPKIALLTAISYAHSAFFSSLEEIAEAKAEIFAPSVEHAFVPKELLSFHAVPKERVTAVSLALEPLPFKEPHLLSNLALVLAVARALHLTEKEIERGLQKLVIPKGRGNVVKKRGITFIDSSYNASPSSVKAALSSLEGGKRKIAVLGSMKELGSFSKMLHREVGEVALSHVDRLYLIGEETAPIAELFKENQRHCLSFSSQEELKKALSFDLQEGDVVLVKGSNSLRLWSVIESL